MTTPDTSITVEQKERTYTIDDASGENSGVLGLRGVLDHMAALLEDDYILENEKSLKITISRHDMTRQELEALPEI